MTKYGHFNGQKQMENNQKRHNTAAPPQFDFPFPVIFYKSVS